MWLFTTLGFFSCTRSAEEPDKFQIRAREKTDLQGLIASLGIPGELIETPRADYRWRIIVDPETFKAVVAELVRRIDYTNFKDAVHHAENQERKAGPYMRVWATLKGLQDRGDDLEAYGFLTDTHPEGEAFYPPMTESVGCPDAFTINPPTQEVMELALENPQDTGKPKRKSREKLEDVTGKANA